jgi:hypothetical protein
MIRVTGKDCASSLLTESIQSAALALESVNDIHGNYSLTPRMLGVCNRVADDRFKEDLEDVAGLVIDKAGDALNAPAARQPTDSRLRNALNIVAQDLAMALGAALPEALSSLSGG